MTDWILAVCKEFGLSNRSAFALQLCLDEAVANIIEHGEGNARAREIVVSVVSHSAEIVLIVEDDGGPFDSTKVAAPQRRESLDDARVGGLGIHLIRQFASSVEYQRKDGRNRLRLSFVDH
jgi:anti-sigma regulatory factor (Ser/Thr protein kinase)